MSRKLHAVDLIPHRRLIDALILGKHSQSAVNTFLKEYGFPILSGEHFNVINLRLTRLFPDHFKDIGKPDVGAVEQSGVRDMFAHLFDTRYFLATSPPQHCFDDAFKAWGLPQVRRSLKAMAFAQISEEEIELYSNAKYGDGFDTEVYMIFFKYFFDAFEWTYQVRREYMQNETNKDLKHMYNLGLKKDQDFIVWKLGLSPTKSWADMLEDMTRDCYYNFKEKVDSNVEEANRWGQLMLKAMDKIKEVEPDDHKAKFGDEFRIQLKNIDISTTIVTKDDIEIEVPDNREMRTSPSIDEIREAMENGAK